MAVEERGSEPEKGAASSSDKKRESYMRLDMYGLLRQETHLGKSKQLLGAWNGCFQQNCRSCPHL